MSELSVSQPLLEAFRAVLQPLLRLAVARGVPFGALDELLRGELVTAAQAHAGVPDGRGQISRIATATGLSRREVGRLIGRSAQPLAAARWPAGELFTRWRTDPAYRGPDGRAVELPRQGPAPSFEALAAAITRDVHPRSLLEELGRLGLARWDEARDTVSLQCDTLVPRADQTRMLGFLGSNVGDHLNAAVDNLLDAGGAHLEQAVYADELSAASVAELRAVISRHWGALFAALVPELERLVAEDRRLERPAGQRVRIGLYSFSAAVQDDGTSPAAEVRLDRQGLASDRQPLKEFVP